MPAPRSTPVRTPLIDWAEHLELAGLRGKRSALIAEMETLRPNSHRRVELRGQINLLTEQLLRAEAALAGDRK